MVLLQGSRACVKGVLERAGKVVLCCGAGRGEGRPQWCGGSHKEGLGLTPERCEENSLHPSRSRRLGDGMVAGRAPSFQDGALCGWFGY